MELILISNTKLKIMLDEGDMKKYHIGSESDTTTGSTGRAIRSLLECAREQIGFNTEGVEIFVQLYASKKGGCELFVTKCPAAEETNEMYDEEKASVLLNEAHKERKSKCAPSRSQGLPEGKMPISLKDGTNQRLPAQRERRSTRLAYSFPSVKELLKVCKILFESSFTPESRAFCDDGGRFYLLLTDAGVSAYSRLDALSFIVEFGRRENPDCIASYIGEHGRIICNEKAIETLSAL